MTTRDLKEAIKLGRLNLDSLKPEFQPALQRRLKLLEAALAKRTKKGRRKA